MLQRLALRELVAWKQRAARKPLLIDGARQVGKSWLVGKLFGPQEFRRVHWLDFRAEPRLEHLFAESLDPAAIVGNIELERNERVDLARDLLFFDEVGECQRAVDSLKYFAERLPSAFVCASGSNIGLLGSFPVGKVEQLELFPLPPRSPELNGIVERANRTVRVECWSQYRDDLTCAAMNAALDRYLDYYNNRRRHRSLGMKNAGRVRYDGGGGCLTPNVRKVADPPHHNRLFANGRFEAEGAARARRP